ncbi:MAG TPA: YCF48-related protein [Chloroflexia bacterium]|nr:YCF48-related protein [Chloroflexia bacterium]
MFRKSSPQKGWAHLWCYLFLILVLTACADDTPTNESLNFRTPKPNPAQILITEDGAVTWKSVYTLTSEGDIVKDISCPTLDDCYAVTLQQKLIITHDSGISWQATTSAPSASFIRISCPAKDICYGLSNSGVQATRNAGSDWSWMLLTSQNNSFQAINCPGLNLCFVAGTDGFIASTTDAGSKWKQNKVEPDTRFWDISCSSEVNCIAVGNKAKTGGVNVPITAVTKDGWKTWTSTEAPGWFYTVECVNESTCFALSDKGIRNFFKTTDKGQNWSEQKPGEIGNTFSCANDLMCVLAGSKGNILISHDGGKNWSTHFTGIAREIDKIKCLTAQRCLVVTSVN